MAFPNKQPFGPLFFRKMILVDWVVSLSIYSDQRAIKGHLLIHIIPNILINFSLTPQNFVWTFWHNEHLLACFFDAHLLIVVIAHYFFDFIPELGHLPEYLFKVQMQNIRVKRIIGRTVHIVDQLFRVRYISNCIHRGHHGRIWHNRGYPIRIQ